MPRTHDPKARYRIEIEERCGCWIEDLTGFSAARGQAGTTLLGSVRDQAALHGVLRHLRDFGLTLVSLARESEATREEEKDDAQEE